MLSHWATLLFFFSSIVAHLLTPEGWAVAQGEGNSTKHRDSMLGTILSCSLGTFKMKGTTHEV